MRLVRLFSVPRNGLRVPFYVSLWICYKRANVTPRLRHRLPVDVAMVDREWWIIELSVRYLMARDFKSCLTHQPTGSDDGNHGVLVWSWH